MSQAIYFIEPPARAEVLARLAALADGRITPEEASDWAGQWLRADATPGMKVWVDDWAMWEGLKFLAGVDYVEWGMKYVHNTSDYRSWFNYVSASPQIRPTR